MPSLHRHLAADCWPDHGLPTNSGGGAAYDEGVTESGGEEKPPPNVLEPVPTDDRRAVLTGCGVWLLALVATVLLRDDLDAMGRGWWLWVCVAGLILGTLGVGYLQTRGRWEGSRLRR